MLDQSGGKSGYCSLSQEQAAVAGSNAGGQALRYFCRCCDAGYPVLPVSGCAICGRDRGFCDIDSIDLGDVLELERGSRRWVWLGFFFLFLAIAGALFANDDARSMADCTASFDTCHAALHP